MEGLSVQAGEEVHSLPRGKESLACSGDHTEPEAPAATATMTSEPESKSTRASEPTEPAVLAAPEAVFVGAAALAACKATPPSNHEALSVLVPEAVDAVVDSVPTREPEPEPVPESESESESESTRVSEPTEPAVTTAAFVAPEALDVQASEAEDESASGSASEAAKFVEPAEPAVSAVTAMSFAVSDAVVVIVDSGLTFEPESESTRVSEPAEPAVTTAAFVVTEALDSDNVLSHKAAEQALTAESSVAAAATSPTVVEVINIETGALTVLAPRQGGKDFSSFCEYPPSEQKKKKKAKTASKGEESPPPTRRSARISGSGAGVAAAEVNTDADRIEIIRQKPSDPAILAKYATISELYSKEDIKAMDESALAYLTRDRRKAECWPCPDPKCPKVFAASTNAMKHARKDEGGKCCLQLSASHPEAAKKIEDPSYGKAWRKFLQCRDKNRFHEKKIKDSKRADAARVAEARVGEEGPNDSDKQAAAVLVEMQALSSSAPALVVVVVAAAAAAATATAAAAATNSADANTAGNTSTGAVVNAKTESLPAGTAISNTDIDTNTASHDSANTNADINTLTPNHRKRALSELSSSRAQTPSVGHGNIPSVSEDSVDFDDSASSAAVVHDDSDDEDYQKKFQEIEVLKAKFEQTKAALKRKQGCHFTKEQNNLIFDTEMSLVEAGIILLEHSHMPTAGAKRTRNDDGTEDKKEKRGRA